MVQLLRSPNRLNFLNPSGCNFVIQTFLAQLIYHVKYGTEGDQDLLIEFISMFTKMLDPETFGENQITVLDKTGPTLERDIINHEKAVKKKSSNFHRNFSYQLVWETLGMGGKDDNDNTFTYVDMQNLFNENKGSALVVYLMLQYPQERFVVMKGNSHFL